MYIRHNNKHAYQTCFYILARVMVLRSRDTSYLHLLFFMAKYQSIIRPLT